MKAAQITYFKSPVIINIVPKSFIARNNLIVKVMAAGVNPADWKFAEGLFGVKMKFPLTLGGDFSGIVDDPGKSGFNKGDEVYGQAHVLMGDSGSFAEYALAGANSVTLKPKISHIDAAAIPLAGTSALQAITEHISLNTGQKILIHGGAGGIGSFAVQIAHHIGAFVAASVSQKDMDYARKLGAGQVFDYRKADFDEMLNYFDAVFDTVGGEAYKNSFKLVKPGGIIVSMVAAPDKRLMELSGVRSVLQQTIVTSERLSKLRELVDLGDIHVHVDKVFSLDDAGSALQYLKAGHPRGKVVIKVG